MNPIRIGEDAAADVVTGAEDEVSNLLNNPMAAVQNLMHNFGTYGWLHIMGHILYAIMACFALGEIVLRDKLTILEWCILSWVLLGTYVITVILLPVRMAYDRNPRESSGLYPVTSAHHLPFIGHAGSGLLTRTFIAFMLSIFRHHHPEARLDAFNDSRFSGDPTGPEQFMYMQWFAIMVCTVCFFFTDNVHFFRFLQKLWEPRNNYGGTKWSMKI